MTKNKRLSKNYLRKVIYGKEFKFFASYIWTSDQMYDKNWSEVDAEEQHGIDFLTWLCHAIGGAQSNEKPVFNYRLTEKVGSAWARSRGWGYDNPVPYPYPIPEVPELGIPPEYREFLDDDLF